MEEVKTGMLRTAWETLIKQYKLFITRELYNSKIGKNVTREMYTIIRHSVLDDYAEVKEGTILKRVKMGAWSSVNGNCSVECVTIGKKVQIAYGCTIVGVTHNHSRLAINHEDVFDRVFIGDNSFVGANCTILPGVNIGKFCVVGAGSVLNQDVSDGHIYMGTPQKPINKKKEVL